MKASPAVRGFTKMPNVLVRDRSCRPDVFCVLATLRSYEINGGPAYPSQTTIGACWGKDRYWANRALQQAVKQGLAVVEKQPGQPNRFRTRLPDDGIERSADNVIPMAGAPRGRARRRQQMSNHVALKADGAVDVAAENAKRGLTADGRDPEQVAAERALVEDH